MLASMDEAPIALSELINVNDRNLVKVTGSGPLSPAPLFLLDNKTHDGQFGYEVFALLDAGESVLVLSLGWVKGSADRSALPDIVLPPGISSQLLQMRQAPTNPLFDEAANVQHLSNDAIWIVQTLSAQWVEALTGESVLGFAQLLDSHVTGLGPNIWQPSVMTPEKHRGYALQWFCMASALLGMFLYAGFRQNKHTKQQ